MKTMSRTAVSVTAALVLVCAGPVPARSADVYGTVTIEGRNDHGGITVWADSVHIAITDAAGKYRVENLTDGAWIFRAWKPGCLARSFAAVTVSGSDKTGIDGVLPPGDVVTDGHIDLLDAGKLRQHYGRRAGDSGWDPALDLYPDGAIDMIDMELILSHWKESHETALPFWNIWVTEPDRSTVWTAGQRDVPVRWLTGNLGGTVTIALHDGISFDTLAVSTPNDGSLVVPRLPFDLREGGSYRVLVSLDDTRYDYSSPFSVEAVTFSVITPDAGVTWWRGQKDVPVEWWTSQADGTVSIVLLRDGDPVDTIASSTENDGSFEGYDVPTDMEPYAGYRILLTHESGLAVRGGFFPIRIPIEIYNPDSTATWNPGSEYAHIQWWDRAGAGGTVSLYLFKNAGMLHQIVAGHPNGPNSDFFYWTVPNDVEPGTDYRILLRQDQDPDYYDWSDYFDIRPKFQVTIPDRNTDWFAGQRGAVVLWEGSGLEGEVQISLRTAAGSHVDYIAPATENDGTYVDYDYLVNPSLPPGRYYIRVYYSDRFYDHSDYFDILAPPAEGQYGWTGVSPGRTLRGVALGGPLTATAVGELGTIRRTTDGGASWTLRESGTWNRLCDVSFSDEYTGTAVGVDGMVLRTENGGSDWTRQRPGIGQTLYAVAQIDQAMVVAVGAGGMVIRTVDGGENWQVLPSGTKRDLKGVACGDASNWVAVGGNGRIITTDDGGDTWTIRNSGTNTNFDDVCRIDDGAFAAVGHYGCDDWGCRNQIVRSVDGGVTWSEELSTEPSYEFGDYGIAFSDENEGNAVGWRFYRTVDGGDTWQQQADFGSRRYYSVDFHGPAGFAAGESGMLLRSDDGGGSWTGVGSQIANLWALDHAGGGTAVAAGDGGLIARTTDGGANWTHIPSGAVVALRCVSFAGPDTGLVVGETGTVLSTVDGGLGWTVPASGTAQHLLGVCHVSGLEATAVGAGGTILQTSDAGQTWSGRAAGTTTTLRSVAFAGAGRGTIVGLGGVILGSDDGGLTWSPRTSATAQHLYDVEFRDASTGIAVGATGTILLTTDGGTVWTAVAGVTDRALISVTWTDSSSATIAGEDGTILRSLDGGLTWAAQPCGTTSGLGAVSFSGALDGIIVGYGGTILMTATGGD